MWIVHANSVFQCILQKVMEFFQIWRARRPQFVNYQPFSEYII